MHAALQADLKVSDWRLRTEEDRLRREAEALKGQARAPALQSHGWIGTCCRRHVRVGAVSGKLPPRSITASLYRVQIATLATQAATGKSLAAEVNAESARKVAALVVSTLRHELPEVFSEALVQAATAGSAGGSSFGHAGGAGTGAALLSRTPQNGAAVQVAAHGAPGTAPHPSAHLRANPGARVDESGDSLDSAAACAAAAAAGVFASPHSPAGPFHYVLGPNGVPVMVAPAPLHLRVPAPFNGHPGSAVDSAHAYHQEQVRSAGLRRPTGLFGTSFVYPRLVSLERTITAPLIISPASVPPPRVSQSVPGQYYH